MKVWQKGIAIVKDVYDLCRMLPQNEQYGLQSQMKKAAISIPSNIAEGYGRNYTKSFSQFLKISRGSLLELETQILIAVELNMIDMESCSQVFESIEEESKMLNSFIKSLENSLVAD